MASLYRRVRIDQVMPTEDDLITTADGRYFVVRGRLWRMSNPSLPAEERQQLVNKLMQARRQVAVALKARDAQTERMARIAVDAAKCALGERGPVWWKDDAPDFNRRLAKKTPYADWYEQMQLGQMDNALKNERSAAE